MDRPFRIALAIPNALSPFRRGSLVGAFSYASRQPRWDIVRVNGSPTLTWDDAIRNAPDGILGIGDEGRSLTPDDTKSARVVMINADDQPFHRVVSNSVEAGRRGAEHLLGSHVDFLAFVGVSGKHFSRLRQTGFERAIASSARNLAASIMDSETMYRQPKAFDQWLLDLPRPCGIVCANDNVGVCVIRHCRALGLNVPDDIAVVGISNNELVCLQASVPLTSVAQNFEEVGRRAAAHLDALLHGATDLPECELVPPGEVIQRESSRVNATRDPLVNRALHIIRNNVLNDITVPLLLDALGKVSRRHVEQRFRAVLNRSPHQEILAHRVRHAQRLIRTTDFSLERICHESGFYDPAHFCRHFKKETGETPSRYRHWYGARNTDRRAGS